MNDITPRRPRRKLNSGYTTHRPAINRPKVSSPQTVIPTTTISTNPGQQRDFTPSMTLFPEKPLREKDPKIKKILRGLTLKRIVLTLLVIVIIIVTWVGGSFIYNAHRVFGGNILSILTTTKLKGESSGRVNLLLAGNSADDPGHQGGQLTDSIMILSIDTKNNSAFMLSIPRDLWVAIPGNGHQKINSAYVAGQNSNFKESGYFLGGMGQLQQIIQNDFGITLNYYALIDYTAFKDAVNAVGGIQIDIQSNDPRGIYDPSIDYATRGPLVRLTNGVHALDGEQALDLARARGDAYGSYGFANSDFDRTEHQRQMLVALKQKAVSADVLSNPAKLSNLANAIGSNVKTDFTLSEVHRLYDLISPITSANVKSLSLNSADGVSLVSNYHAPDGEDALAPTLGPTNFTAIQAFVRQQLSSDPVVKEGATIDILNATNTNGLAAKEQSILSLKGLFVTQIGDARENQTETSIIDNSMGKMPLTRQYLMNKYGKNITTVNPYSGTYDGNFIVILGANQTTISK